MFLLSLCWAASTLPIPKIQAPNLVHLERGKTTAAQIDVSLAKPFHVQANPASKPHLIATELVFEAALGISVSSVQYPVGVLFHLSPGTEAISTYQDHFAIEFVLKAGSKVHKGKQLLHAKLKYQACDEKTCFRPSDVPVEFWVEII
jgi:hypothetical protein